MKRLAGLIGVAALVFTVACGQTDAGITTSVQTRLAADDMVRTADVDVTTDNNVVTLSGEVESAAQKEQALMIARQTDGVRDVIDQLRVAPQAAPTTGFGEPRDDFGAPRDDLDIDRRDDLDRPAGEPEPVR